MKSKTLLFNFYFRKVFSKTIALMLFFTFFNASTIQAQVGSALNFDGINDNVTVTNVPALQFGTNNLTLEAKIKLSGAQANYAGIITKATSTVNKGIQLVCVNNNLALEIGNGTTNFGVGNGLIGTTNLNDGAWHHVAVVVHRPTNTIKLYIDGINEANYTNSAIATLDLSTTTSLFIGKERTSGIYFNGSIDEIRIWNRDLTQCEIQNNRNGELPSGQTDLLAYYQFNQGIAAGNNAGITSLTDSSGNNYNGTLTNFALNGANSNWISPGGVTNGVASPAYSSLTVTTTQTLNSPAIVADLTATGTAVKWYDVAIGGTALVTTTTLVTGTYYVTQTTGTCESPRTAVQVNINGAALDFDGANDKVVVGNAMNAILDPLNKITVEAWVKPTSTTFNGVIIGNYYNSNNEMQFLLRRDFDQFALWVNDGTGFKVVNSGVGTVTLNTWQHVAGVWDGSSLYIYIDGVLKATTTGVTGSGFPTTTNLVVIGSNSYPEPFAGSVDELRIWTRPLTQCEIQNNRNGELPSGQTDLLAYYQFNQGIAAGNNAGTTNLTDSSGNNYNGTLTSFALNGANSNWISPGAVTNGILSPTYSSLSVATTQTLCSSATVDDLTATGTAIKWYDVAIDGTALVAITALASGTYYVTQTTGTCESPRTAVTVTINPTPVVPTAASPQMVNAGTTLANLVATGTNLKWYADAIGGAALVSTTPLTAGLYYVSQTISGCESPRTTVQVNSNGAALDFDGANDYVSCGNIMPATYTKEAWFYVSNLGLQNNLISGGNDGRHALYPSMNFGNRLSAGHNGTWNSVQDPTPIVANTWYHVALTYDAATTTMKLYINGVLVSTNPGVAPFVGGNALRIGAFDNGQNLLGGKIDEVRIWSRALSQAEIQNNMNCELGSGQTGLVAHYQFNQGIDSGNNSTMTTLTDSSGNTNIGTLNGFALTGTTSNWTAAGAVTTGNTCSAFLSVNDVEFSSNIKVYPNPSKEVFYIDTDSRSEIVIFDLVGKIIRTMNANSGTSKLEVSNFPTGMYLMKVTNENNQTKTIKLIKE